MLARHLPHCVFETVVYDDHRRGFVRRGEALSPRNVACLADEVLVLGDLGFLGPDPGAADVWAALGVMFPNGAARALSPVAEDGMDARLRELWRIGRWGAPRSGGASAEALTENLIRLVSPAVRIEPLLLRQVRLSALPAAGPEIEAMVWRHPAMAIHHEDAGALHPEAAKRYRRAFARMDRAQRRAAITAMRDWRGDLNPA
ncbi:MAG: hypothetical protein AAFP78_16600, partial [Pseudomonadota bacterium]